MPVRELVPRPRRVDRSVHHHARAHGERRRLAARLHAGEDFEVLVFHPSGGADAKEMLMGPTSTPSMVTPERMKRAARSVPGTGSVDHRRTESLSVGVRAPHAKPVLPSHAGASTPLPGPRGIGLDQPSRRERSVAGCIVAEATEGALGLLVLGL